MTTGPAPVYPRIAAVAGSEARLALWAEQAAGTPAAAARAFDQVVRAAAARNEVAVAAYLPLLDLPGLARRSAPGCLAAVLDAAQELALEGCLLLLEHPGPARRPADLGPPPDPLLEGVTLGHRKAAARGGRSALLDRLLRDPDPRVAVEVLRNPRLREAEVVAVAARRPCGEAVFRALARSERWIRRPAVRVALASNPHAPPQLAAALTVLLTEPELGELANDSGLHPAVRDGARQVLRWRGQPGGG